MKKISFSVSAAIAVCTLLPAMVFAAEDSSPVVIPTEPVAPIIAPIAEPTINLGSEQRTARLTAIGLQLINARVFSLTALRNKIQLNKNLTTEQKATLVADIDGNVTKLNALAAEIKNWSGDAAGLKAKVQSIYTDYRVFAVLIPKIGLQTTLFVQSNHAAKLDEAFAKVQDKITAAGAKGIDITKWQAALDAAKAKKIDITTKITTITGLVNGLKPADYPDTSKQIMADGRKAVGENSKAFREINASLQFVNKINAETKRTAIKSASATFVAAIKAAQDVYKSAIVEANKLTDKQARKTALKTARDQMQTAKKAAQDAYKTAVAGLRK